MFFEPVPAELLGPGEPQRTIGRCRTCHRFYVLSGRRGDRSLEMIERHRHRMSRPHRRAGRKPWWVKMADKRMVLVDAELLVTAADRLDDLNDDGTVGTIQLAADLRRAANPEPR